MFKTRLISGIILVIIALATIISGSWILFFTLLAVSLIGMRELYNVMKVSDEHVTVLELVGYLGAVLYYIAMKFDFGNFGMMAVIVSMILILFVYVFGYPKYRAEQVMAAFFGVVYVAVMLSFIYLTRNLPDGKFLVWLIFLCSWGCDTCYLLSCKTDSWNLGDIEMKNIAILGSTGSIGTQTLDVVRKNNDLRVVAVSAGKSVEKLEQQIREFHPLLAAVWDEKAAEDLKIRIADTTTKVVSGMDGLLELASMPESDILVTAIVGMIGIRPTMEGIRAGKDIALANKETLVTAGHLIMPMAKEYGVSILPVDSEHSAIFQAIHGEEKKEIHKLLITASGGPFRGRTTEYLKNVTVADTLRHPNWVMGQKITVDSATLVNKGLEVMEAKWLFDMDLDHIQVVVQPQSIIHSMVEFKDGAIMAQLGTPDMRLPIQYALYYPHRRYLDGDRLDFTKLREITFEVPDMETFRGLPMAIQASGEGGSMPTVFNAANELAVKKFLEEKIGFLDIYEIIAQSMDRHKKIAHPDLDEILSVEQDTYQWIESRW